MLTKPHSKERLGFIGTKSGYIEFYMNGEFVRSKKYRSIGIRREILNAWFDEVKMIQDVNKFHYVIKPDL